MTTVTVRLPNDLNKALERICKQEDRNKSWFIKKGLELLIEDMADYYKAEEGYKKFVLEKESAVDFADLAKDVGVRLKNYRKKK